MLVLKRDEVAEDRATLRKLMDLGFAMPITVEDLNVKRITELLKVLDRGAVKSGEE